jgi:hypothetical protein
VAKGEAMDYNIDKKSAGFHENRQNRSGLVSLFHRKPVGYFGYSSKQSNFDFF